MPIKLVFFKSSLNFTYRFSKNLKISNVMKILPMGAEMFQADTHTWT